MLKNYIYVGELISLSGKSYAHIYGYLEKIKEEYGEEGGALLKIGGCLFLRKDLLSLLPKVFREPAKLCTDLSNSLPSVYAAEVLGVSQGYFSLIMHASKEPEIRFFQKGGAVRRVFKISSRIFVEFDPRFMHLMNIGYVPYKIDSEEDRVFAEREFRLNNTSIGMYH